MMLGKDIELIDGKPIAYIKSIKALVISDIHLGYEAHSARRGILVPKVNLASIEKMLKAAVNGRNADVLIITGDIKNDFSSVETEELNEISDLVKFARGQNLKVVLIKGNHDNFIERYNRSFGMEVYSGPKEINGYVFFHGDSVPKIGKRPKMLVMGHEHPSISITNAAGRKESVKCFLNGKYKGIKILVMPAASYFAGNSSVIHAGRMMSPIFDSIDVESMHAIALGYGETIDFGPVRSLRLADRRAMGARL